MSPADTARHIALIRELSRPGGPVSKDAPTATSDNPDWWRQGAAGLRLREPRRELFEQLLESAAAKFPEALNERQALVLAGPPGAGKGSVADRVLGEAKPSYVNIDADEFKTALLHQAITDGSYESWIKPAAVRELEVAGERFFPMEMAALVHEESSRLSVRQRAAMARAGMNIIVDTVLGNEASAVELGAQLERAERSPAVVQVERHPDSDGRDNGRGPGVPGGAETFGCAAPRPHSHTRHPHESSSPVAVSMPCGTVVP